MPLTDFAEAFLRRHLHHVSSVVDDEGLPINPGGREMAVLYRASQSGAGLDQQVNLDVVSWDDDTYSATANVITIPAGKGGRFYVGASARCIEAGDLTGDIYIKRDGTVIAGAETRSRWVATGGTALIPIILDGGDVISLSLNADNGLDHVDFRLWVERLGDA